MADFPTAAQGPPNDVIRKLSGSLLFLGRLHPKQQAPLQMAEGLALHGAPSAPMTGAIYCDRKGQLSQGLGSQSAALF